MTLFPRPFLSPTPSPHDSPTRLGRVDVHSHLLPGIDDGCQTVEDSLACARVLVEQGYTHGFCTPHIWPNLPQNTPANIRRRVADLQAALDAASVPLRLFPGGELNLREETLRTLPAELVSYGMAGRFVLMDLWADRIPPFFAPNVRWLQSQGATVILAHPERMRAVQTDPGLADYFAELGLLLQGNLQCFGDPPHMDTRRVAERYLAEDRYFMLGTDLHNLKSLPVRMAGLRRATELAGEEAVWKLTSVNPSRLLPPHAGGEAAEQSVGRSSDERTDGQRDEGRS
jgi:protein-tyrosine phosphatase